MRSLQLFLVVAFCAYVQASTYGSLSRYDPRSDPYGNRQYAPRLPKVRCPTGFRDDGKGRCIDVDECTEGRIIKCGLNADCFNRKGSFDCLCRPGFKGKGHKNCVVGGKDHRQDSGYPYPFTRADAYLDSNPSGYPQDPNQHPGGDSGYSRDDPYPPNPSDDGHPDEDGNGN